jgi:ketosteroid isomerase-like protein
MRKAISFLFLMSLAPFAQAVPTASPTPVPLAPETDETQIWDLEKAYWKYVKANDLEKYRALWHERFLGWPNSSSSPTGKDHITDWITVNTFKGVKLESYDLEQVAIQITGNIAANHYRIRMTWSGPESTAIKTETLRIHHTWVRAGNTWQIISGMSAPVNAEGK